jgi:NAD(P)-dependent dehydrogenase (short-subunit alcohol dehydrogenase family)
MSTAGKLCLITGATSGHGRAVATALACAGHTVILGCRNPELGRRTYDHILTRCSNARIIVLPLDLASRKSISEAVRTLRTDYPMLDVLINNAGAWWTDRRMSDDGVELVWATNVLGPYLLTRLLMPLLRASGAGRIVNVASSQAAGLDLHDVEFTARPYNGLRAYQASKQAVRMLTWALARRLDKQPVVANALCPGFMKTELGRNAPFGFRAMLIALRPLQVSAERGARTATWLASSPEAGKASGQFFVKCRPIPCGFRDAAACEELFQICEASVRGCIPLGV